MAVSQRKNNISDIPINNFRKKILSWYDKHQRALPWRATKGEIPNPYHVWLSEIMLQQTTVATVKSYFEKFVTIWPTVHDLANVDREDVMKEWAGLGYYARARNLHKCAQIVANDLKGQFPDNESDLRELPGIGDYTSAAITSIAFDKPANVVDGNIERIMARLFLIKEPLRDSKKQLKELAGEFITPQSKRSGDYAQALMDIGATICTPQSPKCMLCPVHDYCQAYAQNAQNDIPVKAKKAVKPQKTGILYWVENKKGEILCETRSEKSMLGGMVGLPTSEWTPQKFKKLSKNKELAVYHSFTHFDLKLSIERKKHEKGTFPTENHHFWVKKSKLEEVGLPTLFMKAVKLLK